MKVLYAVQGTGNGHVSRAREVVPILKDYCDLDVFLSGDNSQVQLPFEVKYRSKGFSFYYSKTGGLDYFKSLSRFQARRIYGEIRSFPVELYDLIINDFECLSAYAARLKKVHCIGFSHQAAFLSEHSPRPEKRDWLGEKVLKHYAPCDEKIGLHFDNFDDFIFKPVIRRDVREAKVTDEGHVTVYLPHFHPDFLLPIFSKFKSFHWHIFSAVKSETRIGNVFIKPISSEGFLKSMASAHAVITGAGFETPAEAIFLGKKILAVPIAGQYEQFCNAAALEKMGVQVIHKADRTFERRLKVWFDSYRPLQIEYPDDTRNIIEKKIFGKKGTIFAESDAIA
jgi:uncharacterized protein (TIGR00661 family)